MESMHHTDAHQVYREVRRGLDKPQKELPSKLFYDRRGSELFNKITSLEAYYPTRTETAILRNHIEEIAEAIGPDAVIIELGSGSSSKTRLLLDRLRRPAGYIPIDISGDYLAESAERLRQDYPGIVIKPLAADYTAPFELPELPGGSSRRVAFYPGSTIGNFRPEQARTFLSQIAGILGPGGGLLIGVDLKKEPQRIERAYNDPEGITAAFNKNILHRINRDLDIDFRVDRFGHRAFYNRFEGRVEMHLVSLEPQEVSLNGETFSFAEGETIHTENSYKYSVEEFHRLAAGPFRPRFTWTDPERLFSLHYLSVNPG